MTHEQQTETTAHVPQTVRRKRRAPRLPGHLAASHDARPSSPSPAEPTTSPVKDDGDADARSVRASSAFVVDQIGELSRMSRSPLMHSAVAQGSVPKSRVRGSRGTTGETLIQPVLGLPEDVRCSPPRHHSSRPGPTASPPGSASRPTSGRSRPVTAGSHRGGTPSASSRHSCAHLPGASTPAPCLYAREQAPCLPVLR